MLIKSKILIMFVTMLTIMMWSSTIVLAQTPISCTEAALKTAVAKGGIITFNCGATPINLTANLDIPKAVTIDGGGLVTLSGNKTINVLASGQLSLQNITLSTVRVVNNSTFYMINSTITGNSCTGITKKPIGCGIYNMGILFVISSTISNNSAATGDGGGIANELGTAEIVNSTISGNRADRGGGIASLTDSSMIIRNSDLTGNTANGANSAGGGIFSNESNAEIYDSTIDSNTATLRGGGIVFWSASLNKTLTMKGSTISNNTATGSGGFGPGGLDVAKTTIVIENCTFAGNSGLNPGAIYIDTLTTTVTIANSTIANNVATSGNVAGIQKKPGSSTLTMKNTFLANSPTAGNNCNTADFTVTDGGGNLQVGSGCVGTTVASMAAMKLGALTDNGGATDTILLNTGSPAINAASGCPTTDQRGYTRVGVCDVGALEVGATAPTAPTLTNMLFTTPAVPGEPVYELKATGSNFTPQSVVMWNGQPLPTKYNSSNELMAYVPIASYTQPGIVPVTVSTGGTGSNAKDLTIGTTISSLTLTGLTKSGLVNTAYNFSAAVLPTGVSAPLVYTWTVESPPDSSANVVKSSNISNTLSFKSDMPGVYTVTVTATNPLTQISASQAITLYVPPTNLTINGETAYETYKDYEFTATVSDNTTLPVTYTWSATGQTTKVITNSGSSSSMTYNWPSAGAKTITVVADNGWGKQTKTFPITVIQIPLGVSLSGADAGKVDSVYTFTASVKPTNTKLPITYTWSATDYNTPVVITANTVTNIMTFTWATAGNKVVTVKASGTAGENTDMLTINLMMIPNSNSVSVGSNGSVAGGQTNGAIDKPYTFTVAVDPTVSKPLTYTWEAVEQQKVVTQSEAMPYTWTTPGVKAITMTVENAMGSTTKYFSITIYIPPSGLQAGTEEGNPTTGTTTNPYTFTVMSTDPNTSQPLTYTWKATDFSKGVTTSSNEIPFTWAVPGVKTVTVAATNLSGISVTQTFTITVYVAPTAITLSGPTTGSLDKNYKFSAAMKPTSFSKPMTYTWEATDHEAVTQTVDVPQMNFSWATVGVKEIIVTADNGWGIVTDTHTINIVEVVPLESVTLNGALTGEMSQSYTFTALVQPETVATPLTYTWQATELAKPLVKTGIFSLTNEVAFNWITTGTKLITVTVDNQLGLAGRVTATYIINIMVPPIKPLEVTIAGATSAKLNSSSLLTATVSPISVTLPISYQWTPEPSLGQGLAVVSYTWTITGAQLITVAATNAGGTVTATHTLTVTAEVVPQPRSPYIYLPIVLKK